MYGSEDSIELQKRIELYKKYNMKIEDSVLQDVKEGEIPNKYLRVFLEETKYLPRDWKPKGYDDIIDDHINEQIAATSWKKGDVKKRYVIWEMEDYKLFDEKRNRKTLDKLEVTE